MKVELGSVEVKSKSASAASDGFGGLAVMFVSGGVASTSQVYVAGVSSALPAVSTA